jgi:Ca2+-binding EF-hand superfamily protein
MIENKPAKLERRETMKTFAITLTALAVVLAVSTVFAQAGLGRGRGPGGGQPGPGGREPGEGMLRRFDANGDGQITEREWVAVFTNMDTDGDGVLSAEEIKASAEQARQQAGNRMFKRFDIDENGSIDASEFPGREEMFKRIDSNGDGQLSQEEFNAAAEKRRQMMQRGGEDQPGRGFRHKKKWGEDDSEV